MFLCASTPTAEGAVSKTAIVLVQIQGGAPMERMGEQVLPQSVELASLRDTVGSNPARSTRPRERNGDETDCKSGNTGFNSPPVVQYFGPLSQQGRGSCLRNSLVSVRIRGGPPDLPMYPNRQRNRTENPVSGRSNRPIGTMPVYPSGRGDWLKPSSA